MESPEHERRGVVEYLEIEAKGELVSRVEKIASERVLGHEYDVWDVETDKGSWWVITNPTNLYSRDEFTSMDHVLSFHIGLMHRVFARQARSASAGDEEVDRLRKTWRKWEQAASASEAADEAEHFQAVGVQCRETLLEFVRSVARSNMVVDGDEEPKRGDFVRWSALIAKAITPTSPRLRAYLRSTAASAWELVNWLTHETNARRFDAAIAVDATAHTLSLFGLGLVRHERGEPERCPECGSYRLTGDFRSSLDAYVTLCEACEWESRPPSPAPG
jgi:hypothetical protein